jgi:putative addiction module component (TIGR02574 family)
MSHPLRLILRTEWDFAGKVWIFFRVVSRYNLPMNRSAAEILEDVRRLPPGEFEWLIGELLQAGDGSSEAEIEASWKAEAERRVAEVEAGTAVTYSWEEVEAPLRARLAG